jgi:hypothetical protein
MHDTDASGTHCVFALLPTDQEDTAMEDRTTVTESARVFASYGFRLDPQSCQVHMARVGQGSLPYQWCRVEEAPDQPVRRGGRRGW